MRAIERTSQFKRDYKRESKGQHQSTLDSDLSPVINDLANDKLLAPKYTDHPLYGNWKDHRDCHIKPNLILIYAKLGENTLRLVRLGSHSELGL